MTSSPGPRTASEPHTQAASSAVDSTSQAPPSPSRSDKSTDSEGKPVRDKLKETRIDAQSSSDPAPASDQAMHDAPNGAAHDAAADRDLSTSESEGSRSRLRRKRSREDFEDDDKPVEKKSGRHIRKKSRDAPSFKASEAGVAERASKSPVGRIEEDDGDEAMASTNEPLLPQESAAKGPATPEAGASDKDVPSVVSPQNKRTHDQTESGEGIASGGTTSTTKDSEGTDETKEERHPKRPREKSDLQPSPGTPERQAKIPAGSGFANTSVSSPFATLSKKPKPTPAEKSPQDLPQTSDDKFKSSGFGGFAASTASPFGGLGKSGAQSPFAAATGGAKVSSFASSTATSTTGSGFGALGSSSKPAPFGGATTSSTGSTVFGGGLGQSAFGGFGGSKSGLSSFATPGASSIVGLSKKPERPFGATGNEEEEEDEEDDDDGASGASDNEGTDKGKQAEQTKRLYPASAEPIETGEEGEICLWNGRAKLYKIEGEGSKKNWKERGAGPFKFNITKDAPKKARFILRADGTHRLLLNAAITKPLKIGDPTGEKPTDGRLYFSTPLADGTLELNLLRTKAERGEELYDLVKAIQAELP